MSDCIEDPRECGGNRDELAELALGILSGRSRSVVLGHVASCSRCSSELEQLSIVADTLLELAPESEPSLGFELRLVERLQAASVHRPRRLRRLGVLSAAAIVMIVLGFGLGVWTGSQTHRPSSSATADLTSARLTSHGQVLGEVIVSADNPAWLFMTIVGGAWSGKVTCEVVLAGGKVETIGAFELSGGYGAWSAPLSAPVGKVRSARLIALNGSVLASAQFLM